MVDKESLTLAKKNSHKIVFFLNIIYCYRMQHIIMSMFFMKASFFLMRAITE